MLLTAAAVTAVAVQSCSDREGNDPVRVPIVFQSSIVESRGAAALTTDGMTDFGLYAAYSSQGGFDASEAVFNNIVNGKFVESTMITVSATPRPLIPGTLLTLSAAGASWVDRPY